MSFAGLSDHEIAGHDGGDKRRTYLDKVGHRILQKLCWKALLMIERLGKVMI